ncbi:MAG: response regulator [Rhodovarius sp.]|nr:response regulator [Rhodovarius sp.]MDW8313926.1 response regulator [Rhodovarius sp.]
MKVLYVDDEPDIREIVEVALSLDPAIDVRLCASGAEALRELRGFAPDLIMLDVMMPGMDGPAVMSEIRKLPEFADTPIIFCTARTQTREAERLRALGACDIVEKPFDPMRLAARLREIEARHLRRPG